MRRRLPVALAALVIALLSVLTGQAAAPSTISAPSPARALTLEERAACLTAIEAVYHEYRIWPAGNSGAKPSLGELLSADTVRARAADSVRQSNALETLWNTPVSGEMLQAEMERMAAETRQPEQLTALFAALDNDPALVAECLARPALAERLLRDWYSYDERFHAEVEARAAADAARAGNPAQLEATSGDYQESSWELGDPDAAAPSDRFVLSESDWAGERARLAEWFGTSTDEVPAGQVSALQEDEKGFFVVAVLEQSDDRMTVASVRWDKTSFETWWAEAKDDYSDALESPTASYTLPRVQGEAMGDAFWYPTPSLPIRTNVSAVWTGSDMIVWGGGSLGTGRSSDGWRYNPATDQWLTINAINAPMGRFAHTAVWTGTEMIVWGGCGPYEFRLCETSSGGRYNPVTGVWTPTSGTNVPVGRLYHTAVWSGSEMIVWGGCNPVTNASCPELNSGGRYNPSTDSWTPTSLTNAPAARTGHTAVWTGSEMIVWGGDDGILTLNTGGRYNPATDSWTATNTANAPQGRIGHTAVWTGSEMIVWGGCPVIQGCIVQGTPINTGGRYNPATDSWAPTSTAGVPSPRAGHSAVWTGTQMIVWGGGTSNNIYYNDGGRYTPGTDSWAPIGSTNAPAPRAYHVAVWTGDVMIVWGGGWRTGGRYDPESNSWTPTSTNDPDSIRSNHEAIWTGVEMIVWGGDDTPNGTVNTGRIYNPATRTWRDTSLAGAPGWRFFHTVEWTGTEMLVWGGQAGSYVYNDGGRYNPASDSWAPITTTGAPQGRTLHSSVWSGSEMIVWGGQGDELFIGDGGRYNPSTNSWSPVTTANAPAGRYLHTAVWDGDVMIVWGGYGNWLELNSGGRYDPDTNSWAPTSTAGAPVPRHYHSAIWTGSEMIVWGGTDLELGVNYNSGGQYDPDSDSWQATSTVNAPEGRVEHTAIWTGLDMIVWGGCTGVYCGSPLYTGGHYDPFSNVWTPTAIDPGIPRARGEHTAVWTGDRMIVWGGFTNEGGYTNTGAEYFTEGAPPPPTPTATATGVPPTATATGVPPTVTATATGVPPTATATTAPPSATATGVPPTVTPSATGVPPTASPTPPETGHTLFLPLIQG